MKYLSMLCCLLSLPAHAAPEHQRAHQVVEQFIQQQIANLPGKSSYKIDKLDTRIAMAPCSKMEAFLPAGSQLVGRTSVGVRCLEKNEQGKPRWEMFVLVQIKLSLNLLTSARPLSIGQTITEADLSSIATEISRPIGFTDPKQILGKVMRINLTAGQIIREDMLRLPFLINQGQTVTLSVNGNGFQIRNEGTALNNASAGQNVQVRTTAGKIVSGIATNTGEVTIRP